MSVESFGTDEKALARASHTKALHCDQNVIPSKASQQIQQNPFFDLLSVPRWELLSAPNQPNPASMEAQSWTPLFAEIGFSKLSLSVQQKIIADFERNEFTPSNVVSSFRHFPTTIDKLDWPMAAKFAFRLYLSNGQSETVSGATQSPQAPPSPPIPAAAGPKLKVEGDDFKPQRLPLVDKDGNVIVDAKGKKKRGGSNKFSPGRLALLRRVKKLFREKGMYLVFVVHLTDLYSSA